jgi:phosphate transport system substrate-binding protein
MPAYRLFAGAVLLVVTMSGCATATVPAVGLAAPKPAEPAIRISGSGAALPLVQKLADAYRREQPTANFAIDAGTNSGGGIQGVLQGTLDLSVANRPLTESETAEALDVQPFARDAVAFAVQQSSTLKGLSTSQVRDIYGGSLTDWQALGGSPGPIVVLDRDPDEPMRSLVLLNLLDHRPVQARTTVLTKAIDMVTTIEALPDALGYTTLALLHIQEHNDVRVLALDGVMPGRESVTSGAYPWQLTYRLINRPNPPLAAQRFLDWVRGPQALPILNQYDVAAAPA